MNIKFFTQKAAVVFVMITITTAFSECVWAGFQIKEKIEIQPDEPDEPELLQLYYNMIFKGEISMWSVDLTRHRGALTMENVSSAHIPESVKKEG
ncbi:MAG: hypothetical protein LBL04_08810, partial [Bacteroidales bacterium]|nr:hypothetical protein [Bacteroidales bacterium]